MKGAARAIPITTSKRAAITPESIASFDRYFSRKSEPVKAANKIITKALLKIVRRISASGRVSIFFHLILALIF